MYPNIQYFISLENNSENNTSLIVKTKLEKNILKRVYPNITSIYSLDELNENYNVIELKNTYIFNHNEFLSNSMLYKNVPFIQEFLPYVVNPIKNILNNNTELFKDSNLIQNNDIS